MLALRVGPLALLLVSCAAKPPPAVTESARVELTERLVLPTGFVLGGVPETTRGELFLRNVGPAGSVLSLAAVSGDGDLCLGTFEGDSCNPWTPPETVAAGELVRVPVEVRSTRLGPHRWDVAVETNDPVRPRVTAQVSARTDEAEGCAFQLPAEVLLASPARVTLAHAGAGNCVLRALAVTSTPAGSLRVESDRAWPTVLQRGEHVVVTVSRTPGLAFNTGVLRIVEIGRVLEVPVRADPRRTSCLVASTSELDLGTASAACSSQARRVDLYNTCSSPVQLEPPRLASTEFRLWSSWSGTIELGPAQMTSVSVVYRPSDLGADEGRLEVRTTEGHSTFVTLRGEGAPPREIVERIPTARYPRADIIYLVDVSPSFVPRRAAVREALRSTWQHYGVSCINYRIGFAPADGAPDAGARLIANDAGAVWSVTSEPDFKDRLLSAFDALPVGSETEACIGPAAELFTSGQVRPEVDRLGVCVTDALEQTPLPDAALRRIVEHPDAGSFFYGAIVATSDSCAPEARDDGTHAALAASTPGGSTEDLCGFTGGFSYPHCNVRTSWYLSYPPFGDVQVFVDGQAAPASDWTYDGLRRHVTFTAEAAPRDGQVIEFKYALSCLP